MVYGFQLEFFLLGGKKWNCFVLSVTSASTGPSVQKTLRLRLFILYAQSIAEMKFFQLSFFSSLISSWPLISLRVISKCHNITVHWLLGRNNFSFAIYVYLRKFCLSYSGLEHISFSVYTPVFSKFNIKLFLSISLELQHLFWI